MSGSRPKPASASHLPAGWARQNLQLPIDLRKLLMAAAATEGHGGIKALGTGAIALLLGAPERARDAIVESILLNARRRPQAITPESVWLEFVDAMTITEAKVRVEEKALDTPKGEVWYIDRIVDPGMARNGGDPPRRNAGA